MSSIYFPFRQIKTHMSNRLYMFLICCLTPENDRVSHSLEGRMLTITEQKKLIMRDLRFAKRSPLYLIFASHSRPAKTVIVHKMHVGVCVCVCVVLNKRSSENTCAHRYNAKQSVVFEHTIFVVTVTLRTHTCIYT